MGEENITSLQTSYEKVLKEIVDVRRQINDNLDRLQQNTEKKLEELHSTLKNSSENIRKHCVELISKIKGYNIKDITTMSPDRSFIIYRKCLDQAATADLFLCKATSIVAIEFHHNKDLTQFLASCKELGSIVSRESVSHHVVDPNKVVSIQDRSPYNVGKETNKWNCFITGICESSNGELVIADFDNKSVKLLDKAYNLIEQLQLPTCPRSMSYISTNEVALTVSDGGTINEILFLRVDKGRIINFNTVHINHVCCGIAYHQGDLFVSSCTAVCQYTMDGGLVKTLYEDKSLGNASKLLFFVLICQIQ
ncbi:hypothetical protein DPMN_144644 [Dreissena polymorpha]|uniref:Uncharacterized protein n=1 Tax=Dreissena polymorpha TaxID=45954 RepID=A0A9D4J084_DREPO|nr:hypothetical protein DPMN_144644 [Dreissena polymorpha]